MTRSQRAVVALVAVLLLAGASRTEAGVRVVGELFGPRVALYLGAQTAQPAGGTAAEPGTAAASAGTVAPPGGATVAASASSAVATVSVEASTKVEEGYVLGVRLTTKDAKPINETIVRFYEVVDLFGSREMLIGSTTTDGQGRASMDYLPALAGEHQIVVRSAARGGVPAAEGRTAFGASVAAPAYRQARPPLADFTDAVPLAVGAVVLAVWFVIGFALLGSVRGIAAEAVVGARATRKEIAIGVGLQRTTRGVADRARAATGKENRT